MESIAYFISNRFIVIAVDSNFSFTANGNAVLKNDAVKKVYKLNEHLATSLVGDYFKINKIKKYVLKLNELGRNNSFDETIEDLRDIFSESDSIDSKGILSLAETMKQFSDSEGNVDVAALQQYLQDSPELLAMLEEAMALQRAEVGHPTSLFLFGAEVADPVTIRMGQYMMTGTTFQSIELPPLDEDTVFVGFNSSTKPLELSNDIQNEFISQVSPLLVKGWELSEPDTLRIIEQGKQLLINGLARLSPFREEPNVLFYELSPFTGYKFTEPPVTLKELDFSSDN